MLQTSDIFQCICISVIIFSHLNLHKLWRYNTSVFKLQHFLSLMNCPRIENCYTFVVKPTLQVPFIEESREGPTSLDDVIRKAAGRASFLYSKSVMYRRWERNSCGASLLPLPFAAKHMLIKFTKSQAKGPLVKIVHPFKGRVRSNDFKCAIANVSLSKWYSRMIQDVSNYLVDPYPLR